MSEFTSANAPWEINTRAKAMAKTKLVFFMLLDSVPYRLNANFASSVLRRCIR
jgi:hypothetical protein